MLDRAFRDRLGLAFRKNAPELKAYLTGRMPPFVGRNSTALRADETPVFFFHEVAPHRFESQLRHVRDNGYETLDGDGVEAMERGSGPRPGAVALTFDDATSTFWTYAFPLLRKYRLRAILFVIPALVPEDATGYPNLEDLWAGRCSREELAGRATVQPLCTWRELALMHQSGTVDLQSHSLTHSRVFVSDRIVDFLHPRYDTYFYENVSVPVPSDDDPARPARHLRLGAPVFEFASRFSGRPRFKESLGMVEALRAHIESHGGAAFFERRRWRRELMDRLRAWPIAQRGGYETIDDTVAALRRELHTSKAVLEERLPGKTIRHFCYPWFEGCDLADELAAEAGYAGLFCGLDTRDRVRPPPPGTVRIRRISEDYLLRLPGRGRASIAAVWRHRLGRFAGSLDSAPS